MSGPSGEACERCYYWVMIANLSNEGECRRAAPVPGKDSVPLPCCTHKDHWCGEFKEPIADLPKDLKLLPCVCGEVPKRHRSYKHHWRHCFTTECGATGPQRLTPEEADAAWNEFRGGAQELPDCVVELIRLSRLWFHGSAIDDQYITHLMAASQACKHIKLPEVEG